MVDENKRRFNGHFFLCCGSLVKVKGGKVKVLTEPAVKWCPLMERLYGCKEINKRVVEEIARYKVDKLGLFCCHRVFNDKLVVPYGASEIISTCMSKGFFECAVTVCDGAGTVITSSPSLVQGIGARLTGIVKTSPVKAILDYIEREDGIVLNPKTAEINQVSGVLRAAELGFKKIAVTVAGFRSWEVPELRKVEKKRNLEVTIFSVCNTCTTRNLAKNLLKADLVWASASKVVKEVVGPKALLQLGVKIPVYSLTKRGKRVILAYLEEFKGQIVTFRSTLPYKADVSPHLEEKLLESLLKEVKGVLKL